MKRYPMTRGLIAAGLLVTVAIGGAVLYRQRKWDGQTRFSVIKMSAVKQVVSFDPVSKEGMILTLPDNLVIETSRGRGSWQVANIDQAGPKAWMVESLCDHLGIYCLGEWRDLNLWDKVTGYFYRGRVQWEKIDLGQTDGVEESTEPDGVKVLRLSRRWDTKAEGWFFSTVVAASEPKLTVVNTTEVAGLGAQAARMLEIAGIKVMETVTLGPAIDSCRIEVVDSGQLTSVAVRLAARMFDCSRVVADEPANYPRLFLGRWYAARRQR